MLNIGLVEFIQIILVPGCFFPQLLIGANLTRYCCFLRFEYMVSYYSDVVTKMRLNEEQELASHIVSPYYLIISSKNNTVYAMYMIWTKLNSVPYTIT